jgi:hypothetical protein
MDYDSPGAYKKNKLGRFVMRNEIWHCDECDCLPDKIVLILRGGYIQRQLCKECEKIVQEEE